jgi:3-oxoadipyl-CoA thiolase
MTEHTEAAYICDAIRTPFGRYGGVLASVRPDDLAVVPLRAILERNPSLDPAAIDDVILGNVNQAGEDNRNVARMSLLLAGIPKEVPGMTVNRLCASGMEAVAVAARAIRAGEASVMLAGGVESMSRSPWVLSKSDGPYSRSQKFEDSTLGWRFVNPRMREMYGVDSMGDTAENVAAEWGISRADQDAFALRSQQRCAAAAARGLFAEEIVAVPLPKKDPVDRDEHPRPDTTAEGLAKLKPVMRPDGTVTAGNASGINDGASALLVASETAAARYGLKPRARIVGTAVAGVAPRVMGIGPVPATKKLLERLGLTIAQMDVVELNEAFAAQGVAVLRDLGLPDDAPQVNPNGGAIAIGHPLGASGGRLVTTALYHLERTGGRYALCTMCIGVGQGIAMVIERV